MDILSFKTVPANSILVLPDQERAGYLTNILKLPTSARDMLFSSNSGSYIRGLSRSNNISPELAPNISFAVLRVVLGKIEISSLTTTLVNEIHVETDIAQQIASEIDQDLFAPLQADLDAFWAGQKQAQVASVTPHYEGGLPAELEGARGGSSKTATTNPLQLPLREGERTTPPLPPAPISSRTPNVLNLKELNARPEQKDLPAPEAPRRIAAGSRTVDLSQRTSVTPPYEGGARGGYANTTNPLLLPLRKGERTAPTPPMPPTRTFPLPPTRRSPLSHVDSGSSPE